MRDMRNYYGILFLLFLVHAIEEYSTQFFAIDTLIRQLSGQLLISQQLFFLLVQFIWLGLLLVLALIGRQRAVPIWINRAIALVFLFELSHIASAILRLDYYPGLYTSLVIVAFGIYSLRALSGMKQ